jgi:hypothetical protein
MKRLVSIDGFGGALACAAALFVLLGIAFRTAWLATHDLQWPYDFDFFRDAAFAKSMMQGHFPADGYYVEERNWYNPLGPAMIAGISRIFGLEPIGVYSHCGAIVGLAVPVAIFGLAISLFGRWAGLASLFAFLYLGPHEVPVWAAPTYSPWLFPNLLSLLPFALTVATALRARERGRHRLWAVAGALLGLTFLAHTATAIVAGFVLLALAWDRKKLRSVAIRWLAIVASAFAVSTPFLATILWHYGLKIQNPPPLDFLTGETDLRHLRDMLWQALNVRNAIALVGLVALFRNPAMKAARLTLLTWLAVCLLLLFYSYARQAWPGARLPGLLPPFHWVFHLRLARTLLLGYGLYCAVATIAPVLARSWKVPVSAALMVTLGALLVFQFRPFAQRFDFVQARQHSLDIGAWPGFSETITWLRRETPPGTVVLAPPFEALLMLGAAGRQTVVIEQIFSNPYVRYRPRAAAAEKMTRNLADHQRDSFLQMAAKHGVSYVLVLDPAPASSDPRLTAPFVTPAFASGRYAVMRVER